MDRRVLGRSGIAVSAIGLGCWAIGGESWRGAEPAGMGRDIDDEESIRAIHRSLDLGVNFLDTANVYGAGHSERVIGRALKGRRDQAVIATKFFNLFDEDTRQLTGESAEPAAIREALEQSLRRLQTDVIDLYQFHANTYPIDQAAEVRDLLETLVSEGKIRSYGWSTDYPRRAAVFAQGPRCATIQFRMNVFHDAPGLVALCEREGLGAIVRTPLAMGMLTGKYNVGDTFALDDIRGGNTPAWVAYFKDGTPNPEFVSKLDAIRDILTSGGRTPGQGALAWLWARSPQSIPVPGFRNVRQVEENAKALEHGPLTPEQMAEIEVLLERTTAAA